MESLGKEGRRLEMKEVDTTQFLLQSRIKDIEILIAAHEKEKLLPDYHKLKAAEMFNVAVEDVTSEMRNFAKIWRYFKIHRGKGKEGEKDGKPTST